MANKVAITFYCIIILLLAVVAVVLGSREIGSNNGNVNVNGMKKMKKISNSDYSYLAAAMIRITTSRSILTGLGRGCRWSICRSIYIPEPDTYCTETLSCGKCIDKHCDNPPSVYTSVVDNDPSNFYTGADLSNFYTGVTDSSKTINGPSNFETGVVDDPYNFYTGATVNDPSNFYTSVAGSSTTVTGVDDPSNFERDDPSNFDTNAVADSSDFDTGVVDSSNYDTDVASSSNTINFNAIMNDYYDCEQEECNKTNTIEEDECFNIHPTCGRCDAINVGELGHCTFAFDGKF